MPIQDPMADADLGQEELGPGTETKESASGAPPAEESTPVEASAGGAGADLPQAAAAKSEGEGEAESPDAGAAPKRRRLQIPDFHGRFRSANFSSFGVLGALWSRDRPTRRMSLVFFLSVIGLFGTGVRGFRYFHEMQRIKAEQEETERMQQIQIAEERQNELQRIKEGRVDLGKFMIPLRAGAGRGPANLVRNIAEVDITLECDRQRACQYIADHIPEVRDLINQELLPIEREYFYSRSGKQTIKDRIKRSINDWLPYGLIRQVYFPVLLIN